MRCHLCGFDLDECPGCGLGWGLSDPEETRECPRCGADLPNAEISNNRVELNPAFVTCFCAKQKEVQQQEMAHEMTVEEILREFPSL